MSGIIGKLSFECDEALARPALEQMLDLVAHREATSASRGIYQAPGIALGSTAPLYDPAGPSGVRAALDGTLVNERELRAELRRLGLEVPAGGAALVGRAYEAWGERCFGRFDGAFACAIWDARERRLLLARDQIGLKPLYFALLHGHGVVFASELRALFADPGVERTWCPEAIDAYLALGYVPAPLTAFERISKLEPAQFIVVDGRRLHAAQYWDLPAARPAGSADDAREVEALIRMATRDQRMDPDGVVLYSGGEASSALLAELPQGAAPVVTIAFDQSSGELARIHSAGQHLGRSPDIEEAAVETPALASQLAAHLDEPIADPSALTQYVVCAMARRHAASAIGGHGATALLAPPRRCAVWDDPIRRGVYTRAFAWQVRELDPRSRMREISAARGAADPLERARYVQVRSVLPESTLAITERAALAAGLTLHLPWLDRRLVEAAATVPAARAHDVSLLRRMLASHLPPSLLPPASSAQPPDWLRSTLAAMVPTVLLAPRFDGRGVVSRPALRQLWEEHQGGRHDHSLRFWSLLMLELWLREHIDGDAADRPLEYAVLKAA